jgi:N-acetylmuramoyl-L-alanine amidase
MRGGTVWGAAAAAAQAMRAEVDWQDTAGRLIVHGKVGATITLQTGSRTLAVGGEGVDLDGAAELRDGTLYAPLRPLLQALGAALRWDPTTLTLKALPKLLSVTSRASSKAAVLEISTSGPCVGGTGAEEYPPRTFVDLHGAVTAAGGLNYVNLGSLLRVRWDQEDRDAAIVRVVGDLRQAVKARWQPNADGCGGRLLLGDPKGDEPIVVRKRPRLVNVTAQQPNDDTTIVAATVTDPVSPGYQLLRRPDRLNIELPVDPLGAGSILPVAGDFVSTIQLGRAPNGGNAQLMLDLRQLIRFDIRNEEAPDRVEFVFQRKTLAGECIFVDPGHGGKDSGGRGSVLLEKDVTLDVAKRLTALLAGAGARPMMTRDRDVFVDLHARPRMANEYHADMYLSIHCNASGGLGTETYWQQPQSQVLANVVHDQLIAGLKRGNRGVFRHSFCVIRESHMPSALVELMFIDRQPEEGLLAQTSTRQMAAASLLEGLRQFVSGTASRPPKPDSTTLQ